MSFFVQIRKSITYKLYAKKKAISHEVLNGNKGERLKKGIYHIQHVNAYHQRLKKWNGLFNGVATRYIDNYLFWFRFLELHKQMNKKTIKRLIVLEACKKATFSPVHTFKAA